jgi:hypothetical protein
MASCVHRQRVLGLPLVLKAAFHGSVLDFDRPVKK